MRNHLIASLALLRSGDALPITINEGKRSIDLSDSESQLDTNDIIRTLEHPVLGGPSWTDLTAQNNPDIDSPGPDHSLLYGDVSSNDALFISILVASLGLFSIVFTLSMWCIIRRKIRLTEEESIREEENQAYLELNSDEQELYFQSKDFLTQNPFFRGEMSLSQSLNIQEKGVNAYEFQKDPMLTNNDLMIINKTELNFFKKFECCTMTNLPMSNKNEVYYFESKIYSLPDPENTIISIGLGIKPYPWFRLPGRHAHSISYDSNGYRRHNQPFKFSYEPPFPVFTEGDVIGIGYRTRNGTVFFTRNGKKINEFKVGGHVKNFRPGQTGQLYPILGANNLCSVHVNLGQAGFVFIEGNVKKWGYAPREGTGPAPPAYNKFNSDILLERSEIDEDDLSEREDDFPPDFWEVNNAIEAKGDKYSYNAYSDENSVDERITLNSILPNRPPSYDENGDILDASSDVEPGVVNSEGSLGGDGGDAMSHSGANYSGEGSDAMEGSSFLLGQSSSNNTTPEIDGEITSEDHAEQVIANEEGVPEEEVDAEEPRDVEVQQEQEEQEEEANEHDEDNTPKDNSV